MSQLTVDALILAVGRGLAPRSQDVDTIRAHLARAPFSSLAKRLRPSVRRQLAALPSPPEIANPLACHLALRTLIEGQWSASTMAADYVDDLHAATMCLNARMVVYESRGQYFATAVAPTEEVVPRNRLGGNSLPLLAVIYSPSERAIISGYQISALGKLRLGTDPIWLSS